MTIPVLRDSLRQLIRYPRRLDRFILMCAQHAMPSALDEFEGWATSARTIAGPITAVELWDPDRLAAELDTYPDILASVSGGQVGPIFAVPSPRLAEFAGRHDALSQLDHWIQARASDSTALSLVGMGGIGKTSLALEFAHSRRDLFPGGIYWLNGQDSLISQCARLAVIIDAANAELPELAAARAFLRSIKADVRALIIVDDLDRPNLINDPIVDAISLADVGARILVTSRFTGLIASHVARLELDTLSQTEAVQLLATTSNRPSLVELVDCL